MHEVVVVVAGGGPVPPSVLDRLPAGAPVVAADGGVDVALALGLRVDVVVGDLDSVSARGLAAAEAAGARVERHPVDKDATDLDLALDVAASMADRLVVLGFDGGRLDHLVAGMLALASPGRPQLVAHLGPATVRVVHGPGEVCLDDAGPGDTVTLVPVGGDAAGVRTVGLRYPLHGERLVAGTTRGVSNVVEVEGGAVVGLESGSLLVIQPGGDR